MDKRIQRLHGQRGQALFETAWLIPFVLMSLAIMCFSARFAVAMENIESAVHYANAVGSTRGVFLRSSLYSLYDGASLGSHNVPQQLCYADGAAEIMTTSRIQFDATTATGRHQMWAVKDSKVSCASGSIVLPAGTLQRALALNYELPVVTANVSSIFGWKLFPDGVLHNLTSQSSARLSTVSNRNLVSCYGKLRGILQDSLYHGADGTASSSPLAIVNASDLISSAPANVQPDQVDGTTCGG